MSMQWDVGYITRKRAQVCPGKTAIIHEGEPVTYGELNERVNRCAHYFRRKGIRKGDRVAVVLLNCVEFLEAYFASAKLGAIFVPLNWRMVGRELEYQINDCGARMLLFHDSFLSNVESIRTALKVEPDKYLYLKSSNSDLPDCPGWAEEYPSGVKEEPVSEPVPARPVEIDDPLAIVYTSGVTGDPKGVILSHEQTYFKNFQIGVYTDMRTDDIVIAQMPLFHSGGLFIVSTPVLNGGVTMVMHRGFDPFQFAEDIQRHRGTIVFALTTMWKMIVATGMLDQIDVSSVRCVVGGGERTPPSLIEALAKKGLCMQQGFGQTENSAMMLLPKEDIHRKMGSIGKPGFFTDIWISGPNGEKLAPGQIGEIVAKGPTVMSGYWNLPEATAKTIVHGVLHTGDLGYTDEEGYFYIVDRAKDMYRSGGENVYPAEVEKVLLGYPRISNVAIVGIPDERWGETGLAVIVPQLGETLTAEEIRDYLTGKVGKFKFPTHYRFVDDLPMVATMKVKKAVLKEQYERGEI